MSRRIFVTSENEEQQQERQSSTPCRPKSPYLPHPFEAVSFIEVFVLRIIESASPIDFFGEDFLNRIVADSNIYAQQKGIL